MKYLLIIVVAMSLSGCFVPMIPENVGQLDFNQYRRRTCSTLNGMTHCW